MEFKVYNTLTHQKEEFIPIVPGKVGMYSCGPTVYWNPSIGNYRATFTADLFRNILKILGYQVTAVMNITDVGHLVSDDDNGEDKLEKGSRREGISAWDVAKRYETLFKEGMKKLHIDLFDVMPRATEHIPEQIAMIKTLEEKLYTYLVPNDGIYMDTSKVEDYGKLMGPNYKKRLEDLQAGERVNMKEKKHPTDFALWKFSPITEKRQMERDSPRGIGFPGWHIECSAMSIKYLGQQFDIHHGGADHITIHHPNEIAQSECACGCKPWVKYWIHNEFLQVDGGKMGKSLGNTYTLEDIEKRGFSCLDLKYLYFMAQYNNFQNFTWDALETAKSSRKSLQKKLQGKYIVVKSADIISYPIYKQIMESLCDNINTPKMFADIYNGINEQQTGIYEVISWLEDNFLKLDLFITQEKSDIPVKIIALAEQRMKAKREKNFKLSDDLRNQIIKEGWEIKDSKDSYNINCKK